MQELDCGVVDSKRVSVFLTKGGNLFVVFGEKVYSFVNFCAEIERIRDDTLREDAALVAWCALERAKLAGWV
ncbi:MAG: hypothetical protein AAF393_03025 [Pseudomonadota bacterium]